eukprot:763287-Hanusia_phi.AAC.2
MSVFIHSMTSGSFRTLVAQILIRLQSTCEKKLEHQKEERRGEERRGEERRGGGGRGEGRKGEESRAEERRGEERGEMEGVQTDVKHLPPVFCKD